MSRLLSAHDISTESPLALVYGNTELTVHVINVLLKTTRVIHVGSHNMVPTENPGKYTFVKQLDADLLKRLHETISYSIFFIQKPADHIVLRDLLDKFKRDHTKTLVIIPVREASTFMETLLLTKTHENIRVLLLGDVLSPVLSKDYVLSSFIATTLQTRKAAKIADDLTPVYPISLRDVMEGISMSLFGELRKSPILFLFYEIPQTFISLVYSLREIEPELGLHWTKSKEKIPDGIGRDEIIEIITSHTSSTPSYFQVGLLGFEAGIKEYTVSQLSPSPKKPLLPRSNLRDKISLFQTKLILNASIIGLLLFFLINICLIFTGIYFARQAMREIQTNDFPQAQRHAQKALILLDIAEPVIHHTVSIVSFFAPTNYYVQQYPQVKKQLALVGNTLNSVLPKARTLGNGLSTHEYNKLSAEIIHSYFQIEKLQMNNAVLKSFVNEQAYTYIRLLPTFQDILGYNSPKTYLLLFQNNAELRPNGGFIGSIGEITLQEGKLTNYFVQDVYEPDGQLKEHIEPHYIIRRHLQPHLYLRDSNFSLDFQTSATYSAQLYHLSTGTKVDGVVAIDFTVLEEIIAEIGPITLDSYNTTLTRTNTFDFLQDTIEKNFFPGSTGKKDVLSAVLDELTLTLQNHPEKSTALLKLFPSFLKEKHILFAFQDPTIQQPFTLLNLGGTMADTRSHEEFGVYDYLSINEANIGVNKANRSVSQSVKYTSSVNEQEILSKADITLTNNFNQRYMTYMRVVAPANSILDTITINGVEQSIVPAVTDFSIYERENFQAPDGFEVDVNQENGFTVFGFITTVPPKQRQTISITYQNGLKPSNNHQTTYSLFVNKQPGTHEYPFTFTLQYPPAYTVKDASNAQFGNAMVSFTKSLTTDEEIKISLEK